MAIRQFLAMTPGEICHAAALPEPIGWLGCRFSSSGKGLTQIPQALPEGSLLIITDQTPPDCHDPLQIAQEAASVAEKFGCSGIILDFQRPHLEENAIIGEHILENTPCPLAISEHYATKLDCPIFLSSIPPHQTVEEYLRPWQGREIWLELALDGVDIRITKDGSAYTPVPYPSIDCCVHKDAQLHCHYSTELTEDAVIFHLMRTAEDLPPLLTACQAYGVTTAIGLYQEMRLNA